MSVALVGDVDKWQQRQVPRTLDFAGEVALAARTIAGLAAWTDLPGFGDEPLQRVDVLVVEAFAIRAVLCLAAAPTTPTRTWPA